MPSRPPNCMVWATGSGNKASGSTSWNGRSRVSWLAIPPISVDANDTTPSTAAVRHRGDGSRPSGRTKAIATVGANSRGQPWVDQLAATRAPVAPKSRTDAT